MDKLILLISFFLSFAANAKVSLELGSSNGRFEINQTGPGTSFSTTGFEGRIGYQYKTVNTLTWGADYQFSSIEIGSSDFQQFESTSFSKSRASLYLRVKSLGGYFAAIGVDQSRSPNFYIDSSLIKGLEQDRTDVFLKLGVYFLTNNGGGELSYKLISIPNVELNGFNLKGSGSEVYMNVFFNKRKTYGVYFKYLNEFTKGEFDHVLDMKSIGLIFRTR